MAELTWRNVDAPNIDVRNLAVAGNSIGDAFSRFSTMLSARDAQLKQEHTNAALANVLTAQNTDDALAAFKAAQAAKDPKINLLDLAKGYNEQYSTLQDRFTKDDAIQNSKAEVAFGAMLPELQQAYYDGNMEKVSALRGALESDPLFGRFAAKHVDTWIANQRGGVADRQNQSQIDETGRHDRAGEANAAGTLALAQRRFALDEKDRNDAEKGTALGLQFAKEYRLLDGTSAKAKLYDDPRFAALNPVQQAGVLKTFDTAQSELSKPLASDLQAMEGTTSQIAAVDSALTARANAAEAQAKSPDATMLRRSEKLGDLNMDPVAQALAKRMGPFQNESTAREGIQRLMTEVKGATLADVQAAIDANGYDPGLRKYSPLPIPWLNDIDANAAAGDVLKTQVQRIVDARKAGYTANEAVDIANAQQPYKVLQQKIADTQAQLLRYQRAGEMVPPVLDQRLEQLLKAARERAGK